MQQHFLTKPLEFFLQNRKSLAQSPKEIRKRFCFRNKILRLFFCGHLEWSFNITAKNISSKVPETLDGTKIKKLLYKKTTSKIPPKNWNCLPTKLLKKCSGRKSELLLGSDNFIVANFFPQQSSLFSNILFGNKESSFLNSHETFSEELWVFFPDVPKLFSHIPTKK